MKEKRVQELGKRVFVGGQGLRTAFQKPKVEVMPGMLKATNE
jgi:hypothetical protein